MPSVVAPCRRSSTPPSSPQSSSAPSSSRGARPGFDANAAALACLEAGLSIAATGVALSGSGYSDREVLDGLRACGRGLDPTTASLAEAGWSPLRLAVMLREAGALEPEVREVLRKGMLYRTRDDAGGGL